MIVHLIVPKEDPRPENASMSLGSIEAYISKEKAESMMKAMKSPNDDKEKIVITCNLNVMVKPHMMVEDDGQTRLV